MTELHRILRRQIRKAMSADGRLDEEALLKFISRSYQEQEEDSDRTDRSIRRMIQEVEQSNAGLAKARDQLFSTLEAIRHGIMMVDAAGQVQVCNSRACEILGLPPAVAEGGSRLGEVFSQLGSLQVESGEDASTVVLTLPGDRIVEIHIEPMAENRKVILVEDITADRRRERALRQAESEYRSLFENSVYGIYRDTLDGKPVRANPALVALNRYKTETEQLDAVREGLTGWYVDTRRSEEFHEALARDGRVHDFVSEVYRHATKERLWVTENAWYVRDADGKPLFIEGTIQDANERIASQQSMTRLADFDQLTGATSRYRFMQTINEHVSRNDRPFVLYCIDLDRFKDINDAYGHAAGDEVLKDVVRRLSRLLKPGDTMARLGGDEFAILSPAASSVAAPDSMARRIVDAMAYAMPVEVGEKSVGASVGIAQFPDHGGSAEDLLKSADMALYEVKTGGRNGWRMFDHEIRTGIENRKTIETALRGAAQRNQLDLVYQPIVASDTGAIVAFEALMRFTHPTLGQIPPSEFIPIAEQAGLMTELGAWAISRACEAAAILSGAQITVNVSAIQFRAAGLLEHVRKELRRCLVAPNRLTLEITESALMANEALAHQLLHSLRELGVQIAIDDFGTGYSSLGYLRRLPISVVKIDRSFVSGIGSERADLAVVRAILGIGRDLGIQVVAEGVETEEQKRTLVAEGCQMMQGYLFGRPVPLTEASADLAVGLLPRLDESRQNCSKAPPDSKKRVFMQE